MRRLRVWCRRCDLALTFVARLDERDLRALQRHLQVAHPDVAVPTSIGDLLAEFYVSEVDS